MFRLGVGLRTEILVRRNCNVVRWPGDGQTRKCGVPLTRNTTNLTSYAFFWGFPGDCTLNANVSEHSVPSS
jgi:hypothetical protein